MDATRRVIEFLQMAARGDVREAYARHVGDGFVHHNPWFAHDRQSLLEAMADSAAHEPNKTFDVIQAVADGERVAVHSRLLRETGEQYAVVHIVRLQDGKIAELWDIVQPVPSDAVNALGMF